MASVQLANAIALVVAAMTNTWANRRWTFGVRGRAGTARHQVQGLLVLALTLVMTSGGLWLLGVGAPTAPTWVETTVVAVTTAVATAVKFLSMKWWVFRGAGGGDGGVVRLPALPGSRADGYPVRRWRRRLVRSMAPHC
jgi:putative flippase GtrA